MAVNSFIAALGNILEGASSDRERTRKLKELEEEREYTRLERRQLAEDRVERRAREKQAEADRLEALGYESETVLKSRLAGLGDAPAYEPGAASFDLGMDGVASKPSVGSLKPSPFSGSRLGVIGQDPFSGAKAQGMVEGADKAEQRKETQRRLASLVDVAGQGRMYATTRAQQLAAEEQRLAGVTERADAAAREKTRIEGQAAELDKEQKRDKAIANLIAGGMTRNEATAVTDADASFRDIKETPTSRLAQQRALSAEHRALGVDLSKAVIAAQTNLSKLLTSALVDPADVQEARDAVDSAKAELQEFRTPGVKTKVKAPAANPYGMFNDPLRNPFPQNRTGLTKPTDSKKQIDAEQYQALIDAGYSSAEIAVQYTVKR